jgi:GINS complex subunit 3
MSSVTSCSYYDLDTILSEEERVTAEFSIDAYGLGYLDPARDPSTEPDVAVGCKLDLPYWMIQPLNKRNWVEFQFPKIYGKHFREVLRANSDPQVVSLHDKAPYFEDFGLRMASDVCEHNQEGEQAAESREAYITIQNAMVNRSQHLLDLSENSSHEDTSKLVKGLTERERELFSIGQASSQSFRAWKERNTATIKKAQVGKKRSRGH